MGEIVRLKSGFTTIVKRVTPREILVEQLSGVSRNPVLKSGVCLVVRLKSAVRTEETEI